MHRLTADGALVTVDKTCVGTDLKTGRELFHWELPNEMVPDAGPAN
jgi:hypothetical protein